jgi:CHAT domain-containing protein
MAGIDREVFGGHHPLTAQALMLVADVQARKRDFSAARASADEALAICRAWYGQTHWRVTDAQLALGRIHRLAALDRTQLDRLDGIDARLRAMTPQRRFEEGKTLLLEKQKLQKELLGEPYQDSDIMYLLAGQAQGRSLARGEEAWRSALEFCQRIKGEKHPEYARGLTQLGVLYRQKGDSARSAQAFAQAVRIYQEVLGAYDMDYAGWVMHLARMEHSLVHEPQQAEALFRLAGEIYETCRGDRDAQYAECLNQLGHMHYDRGAYAQAEDDFKRLLELRKAASGERSREYIQALLSLAMVYQAKRSEELAGPLVEKAKRLGQLLDENKTPETAPELRAEAIRLGDAGRYADAEKMYQKLLELDRRVGGERDSDYQSDLWRLAALYESWRNYAKAAETYERALETARQTRGEDSTTYRSLVQRMAALYMEKGDDDKAEKAYKRLAELYQKSEGDKGFNYGYALERQAQILLARGDLAGAAGILEKALPILRSSLGGSVPLFTARLFDLASIYERLGQAERAEPLMREGLACHETVLEDIFSVQSERQRLESLRRVRDHLDRYMRTAGAIVPAEILYDHALRWKDAVAFRPVMGWAREQPELRNLFEQLARTRARLADLAFRTPVAGQEDSWSRQLHALRNDKENLESEIARQSELFRLERRRRQLSARDVARALPAGATLIDFLEYAGPQEERRLLAFIVKREGQPVRVDFEAPGAIARAVRDCRSILLSGDQKKLGRALAELRERLWKPLEAHINGRDWLLIAPDGGLCYLPFAMLPSARPGSYLIEDYAISYVTSGRQVFGIFTAQPGKEGEGLLAIGGIDYRAGAGGSDRTPVNDSVSLMDASTRAGFGPLPVTEIEARRCGEAFKQTFPGSRLTLLSGAAPTVTRVQLELKEHYRYLHLATHGFFESPGRLAELIGQGAPGSGRQAQAFALLPMLRSGLAFAGAGRPASAGETGRQAGLLTAEDVAGLDLRGTELAVLSACDTGLGEIEAGQGVTGLERAFQQAGASALIASLWMVDDAAASVLMENFYTNLWQKRLPKLEALRRAQLAVLRDPAAIVRRRQELAAVLPAQRSGQYGASAETGKAERASPFFWAAFVLCGDPR